MINYTYSQILEMDDLSRFSPMESIGILGHIFEKSRQDINPESLSKGLEFAKKLNISSFTDEEKTCYYYNLSNGWAYKLQLRISPNEIEFNSEVLHITSSFTF